MLIANILKPLLNLGLCKQNSFPGLGITPTFEERAPESHIVAP